MKAIYQSINDRSKIKAVLHNVKLNFKEIRSYEKILSTPILLAEINEGKARQKINSLINEAVNQLSEIENLCSIYHELFSADFQEAKTTLHKIVSRQKLTPIN